MQMRYSLKHHYLNSQFNRLAKNNRHIGPDAMKTWRRITMKNKTENAQQEEHEVQNTNQEKQEEANPDMNKRVTRSGAVFLATVSKIHSILKQVPYSQDYNMAVILTSSSYSLSALKKGIKSQDNKVLTEAERVILSINHTKLNPTNIFSQDPTPSHSGNSVQFSEKIKVWFPDEDRSDYMILKDPNPNDSKNIPTKLFQYFDLDFSTTELFQICEKYHGEILSQK